MSETEKLLPLQIVEAMGSEHTSYGSTKRELAKLPTKGLHVIQGPGENAGIIDIGNGYALALRMESHNHPYEIEPFMGAATGLGGILRDIFTMGARPIGSLDIRRAGVDMKSRNIILPGGTAGISHYGTTIGVPTVGGEIYFDKTFTGNNLVNVCAFGLVEKRNIIYGNALTPGADLIYVGARTGRDGVGGAQMASENLSDNVDLSTVQDADPYLEKLLLDACVELAKSDFLEGMQDMGAAGILCSTSEVVLRGRRKTGLNLGAIVDLDKIPTKADNMTPIEYLLSESQERMLIVGKREHRRRILDKFKHWDLEAVVCGTVTNDGKYTVKFTENGRKVTLPMDFGQILPDVHYDWPRNEWQTQKSLTYKAHEGLIKDTWHQYDWMVGTRTLKGPNEPGKYAILDIPEAGGHLVITWSSDEGNSNIDPRSGIEYAFKKSYDRMLSLGATPMGLTNCFNGGHPEVTMGAFTQTIDGLTDMCNRYEVPVISGNISLYNASGDHSIKPTPVLVMAGMRYL